MIEPGVYALRHPYGCRGRTVERVWVIGKPDRWVVERGSDGTRHFRMGIAAARKVPIAREGEMGQWWPDAIRDARRLMPWQQYRELEQLRIEERCRRIGDLMKMKQWFDGRIRAVLEALPNAAVDVHYNTRTMPLLDLVDGRKGFVVDRGLHLNEIVDWGRPAPPTMRITVSLEDLERLLGLEAPSEPTVDFSPLRY